MKQDLNIVCKCIADISAMNFSMNVALEECDLSFISDISSEDIALHCNDHEGLIEHIDEDVIHEYLRSHGYIYNKA